jgi:hypothetical protein
LAQKLEANSMRLLPLLQVIAPILSLLLCAGGAHADMITGSYSGLVFASPAYQYFDYGNYFGLGPNANLGGLPISGTFSYDPSGAMQQCGTTYCNYFGVIDSITATIGGHTISVSGTQQSEISLASHDVYGGNGTEFDLLAVNTFADMAVLVRTFSDQFFINAFNPNSPNFSVSNPDQFIGQLFFTHGDSGFNFTITNFDVSGPPNSVPGPVVGSGWPGLIFATGVILATLRNRSWARRFWQ